MEIKNVKLEETGLFGSNPDKALNCLEKNDINNLEELLNINISNLDCSDYRTLVQLQGIIYLLRYKYLGIDLPFGSTLGKKISNNSGMCLKNENSSIELISVANCLIGLGFTQHFSTTVQWHFKGDETLIQCLQHINNLIIESCCNPREKDSTKEKLKILISWYYDKYLPSLKDEEEYSDYKKISVFDTQLIHNSREDIVTEFLKNNKITNLQELFLADDKKHLNYIKSGCKSSKYPIELIESTISLLRFKYLREKPFFDDVLETEIVNGQINGEEQEVYKGVSNRLMNLGLPVGFAKSLSIFISSSNYSGKIVDILKKIYYNDPIYSVDCTMAELVISKNRIGLILESYNQELTKDISFAKNKLNELRERLIELKEKKADLRIGICNVDSEINYTQAMIRRLEKDLSNNS